MKLRPIFHLGLKNGFGAQAREHRDKEPPGVVLVRQQAHAVAKRLLRICVCAFMRMNATVMCMYANVTSTCIPPGMCIDLYLSRTHFEGRLHSASSQNPKPNPDSITERGA